MFEAEVWLIAELVLGFCFFNHDDVLDPNAESTVFVITWLVGYHVSRGQRYFGVLDSGANADWSFVDIEV